MFTVENKWHLWWCTGNNALQLCSLHFSSRNTYILKKGKTGHTLFQSKSDRDHLSFFPAFPTYWRNWPIDFLRIPVLYFCFLVCISRYMFVFERKFLKGNKAFSFGDFSFFLTLVWKQVFLISPGEWTISHCCPLLLCISPDGWQFLWIYIDSRVTATWKIGIAWVPKSVTKERFSNLLVISVFLGTGQHVLLRGQAAVFCTSPFFMQCSFIPRDEMRYGVWMSEMNCSLTLISSKWGSVLLTQQNWMVHNGMEKLRCPLGI